MDLTVQLLASISLNRERCKVPGSPWVRQCRFWLFFSSPLVAMTLAACTHWVPNVSDQHSWLMIILNPRTFCWGFKIIRDHTYPYLNPFLFVKGRYFYHKKRLALNYSKILALFWPANGRRCSSLIAADGRFAKRPSAAMSEEKRLPFAG